MRDNRFYDTPRSDNRTAFQIDRDRVLYSSAFQRLAHVTQVVSADETHIFHNRLTHSLQVAQVARRIAEFLASEGSDHHKVRDDKGTLIDVNPDVCEAAALCHDLGHPPYGHITEELLQELTLENGLTDSFEGNAQSFRIVNKLSSLDISCPGLDLTRATLNAILKYPWMKRQNTGKRKRNKWGAYASERREFEWARELTPNHEFEQCIEAAIMDWADDVTYSVHDLEDFYRAGLIPLDRLGVDSRERQRFLDSILEREKDLLPYSENAIEEKLKDLTETWTELKPYEGGSTQRKLVRTMSSQLIGQYVRCVSCKWSDEKSEHVLDIPKEKRLEVFILKQLTWHYVILRSSLSTQQAGQKHVIRTLFGIFNSALNSTSALGIFPHFYREELLELRQKEKSLKSQLRVVVDFLSSMTEKQALTMFQQLTGSSLGSALTNPLR